MQQAEITWRLDVQGQYITRLEETIADITRKNAAAPHKPQRSTARWQRLLDEAQTDRAALEAAAPSPDPVVDVATLSLKDCKAIVCGLSSPGKMPCYGYNLPAWACGVGSQLRVLKGTPCSTCYARKGRYVWPYSVRAMYRRMASLGSPLWVSAMARLITHYNSPKGVHRWHDSGDLVSPLHLHQLAEVARLTPDVQHWLPTQERKHVTHYRAQYGTEPANLLVRFSSPKWDVPVQPWTKLPGTVASYVSTTHDAPPPGVAHCPAPAQGGRCLDCRNCWTPQVLQVRYARH